MRKVLKPKPLNLRKTVSDSGISKYGDVNNEQDEYAGIEKAYTLDVEDSDNEEEYEWKWSKSLR